MTKQSGLAHSRLYLTYTMAANSDEDSPGMEDSSEDESLATLKRKAEDYGHFNDDSSNRPGEDSYDDGLLPGICVKVEVQEMDIPLPDSEAANLSVDSVSPIPHYTSAPWSPREALNSGPGGRVPFPRRTQVEPL